MSITKEDMEFLEREKGKTYRVVIRRETGGLGGVTYPETQTLYMGDLAGAKRVVQAHLDLPEAQSALVKRNQIWVEYNNFIVAIVVAGGLLWLDKVPPPKYWLNINTRPRSLLLPDYTKPDLGLRRTTTANSCGIPLPSCLTEQICR